MSGSNEKTAIVGFVVIGRNEGERLLHSLRSVLQASKRVVYADSRSTDGSVELARGLGVETVMAEGNPMTAARGRNAGYAALRKAHPECELIQFLDGDCILSPDWVDTARDFLVKHSRAAAACGRRIEAYPNASFYNRVIDDEWDTPVGFTQSCGGDALVRIAAFEEVGGFNPDLIAGEEPDFCARLREAGWEIWRLDAPMTRHDAAIHSLSQWMRRADRSGFGYAQVWGASRSRKERLYAREIRSALGWGAVLPLVTFMCAIAAREPWVVLALPAAYALQIARIAARQGIRSSYAWKYASLVMTAKLGEAKGVLRYFLSPRTKADFNYKLASQAERRPA